MNYSILSKVKKALMIPVAETYADCELNIHILACRSLIGTLGANREVANSNDPIVEALIIIYCKTFFGFKNDGSVRELPLSFNLLVKQLVLTQGG